MNDALLNETTMATLLLAQTVPGEAIGIAGGFGILLAFLVWFAKQLHADGRSDRAAAAAERLESAKAYKETAHAVATVVDRNTDAHIRANIILTRVEDRLDREERKPRET